VWDIPPREICDRHLVAEHGEIHSVVSVIHNGRRGFANHPEVKRWRGHLGQLARRHDLVAREMAARGFRHASPLPELADAAGSGEVWRLLSDEGQRALLRAKDCPCGMN
jgi:hypothetical protein